MKNNKRLLLAALFSSSLSLGLGAQPAWGEVAWTTFPPNMDKKAVILEALRRAEDVGPPVLMDLKKELVKDSYGLAAAMKNEREGMLEELGDLRTLRDRYRAYKGQSERYFDAIGDIERTRAKFLEDVARLPFYGVAMGISLYKHRFTSGKEAFKKMVAGSGIKAKDALIPNLQNFMMKDVKDLILREHYQDLVHGSAAELLLEPNWQYFENVPNPKGEIPGTAFGVGLQVVEMRPLLKEGDKTSLTPEEEQKSADIRMIYSGSDFQSIAKREGYQFSQPMKKKISDFFNFVRDRNQKFDQDFKKLHSVYKTVQARHWQSYHSAKANMTEIHGNVHSFLEDGAAITLTNLEPVTHALNDRVESWFKDEEIRRKLAIEAFDSNAPVIRVADNPSYLEEGATGDALTQELARMLTTRLTGKNGKDGPVGPGGFFKETAFNPEAFTLSFASRTHREGTKGDYKIQYNVLLGLKGPAQVVPLEDNDRALARLAAQEKKGEEAKVFLDDRKKKMVAALNKRGRYLTSRAGGYKLTQPDGENALESYKKALKASPRNPESIHGLEAMVRVYLGWLKPALKKLDLRKSMELTKRMHPVLTTLKKSLSPREQAAFASRPIMRQTLPSYIKIASILTKKADPANAKVFYDLAAQLAPADKGVKTVAKAVAGAMDRKEWGGRIQDIWVAEKSCDASSKSKDRFPFASDGLVFCFSYDGKASGKDLTVRWMKSDRKPVVRDLKIGIDHLTAMNMVQLPATASGYPQGWQKVELTVDGVEVAKTRFYVEGGPTDARN